MNKKYDKLQIICDDCGCFDVSMFTLVEDEYEDTDKYRFGIFCGQCGTFHYLASNLRNEAKRF